MPVAHFGEQVRTESGTILMWAGALSDIPNGWVLCDGNNGTPNLLDRFAKSVPNGTTDPGATGGSHSYSLSTSQLPSHGHSVSVDSAGSHNHGIALTPGEYYSSDSTYCVDGYTTKITSGAAGSHNHTYSSNNTGSGSTIENRPKYYQMAFIMKT